MESKIGHWTRETFISEIFETGALRHFLIFLFRCCCSYLSLCSGVCWRLELSDFFFTATEKEMSTPSVHFLILLLNGNFLLKELLTIFVWEICSQSGLFIHFCVRHFSIAVFAFIINTLLTVTTSDRLNDGFEPSRIFFSFKKRIVCTFR